MKALTGLSTNEYIRKVKMQNAERLLLEGKYNISEIAYKIGMNSTGYFRQCFKDEFGVSPSDYLKQFTSQLLHHRLKQRSAVIQRHIRKPSPSSSFL